MKLVLKNCKERLKQLKKVDLNKNGWIKQVSILWNVSHTQVTRYMKLYFSNFLKKAKRRIYAKNSKKN